MSLFEQEVLPKFEESQPEWIDRARATAEILADTFGTVTVDMVRDRCPPPPDADPRIMGSIFVGKGWECIGYERSTRKACHNRPIGIFQRVI